MDKTFLDLLCPHLFLARVEDIHLEDLKRRGYEALIFDLDNTLVSWRSFGRIKPSVRQWVERARELGFKMHIVSNCRFQGRVAKFSRLLGIPAIPRALKPRPDGFQQAIASMGCEVGRTAVIGDQIFTDVLGGNKLGLLTILVLPVDTNEFFATILTRTLERITLLRLRRSGRLQRLLSWPEDLTLGLGRSGGFAIQPE